MTNFFKARWNKDNFWNLMFFVFLIGGTAIAFVTDFMIISWFAIGSSIWIIKSQSKISFDKEKKIFVINETKEIEASGAELVTLILLSFGAMASIGLITDSFKMNASPALLAILMSLPILFLTLYCIIRNFPIAVYFKKEAWIGNKIYSNVNQNHSKPNNWTENNLMHPSNYYRDIRNSGVQGNIYYRK